MQFKKDKIKGCRIKKRVRRDVRPDMQVFPGLSLSAHKKEKVGIQPSCSVFDKGPFGELSSKSEG